MMSPALNVLPVRYQLVVNKVNGDRHHYEHEGVVDCCLEDHHSASSKIVGGDKRCSIPQRQCWRCWL